VSDLNIGIVLQGLRSARRETLMAWCPSIVGSAPAETADHLMNALLDVELAIVALEKHEDDPAENSAPPDGGTPNLSPAPSEIRDMASALASKARTS
jgi:hypothetical protein